MDQIKILPTPYSSPLEELQDRVLGFVKIQPCTYRPRDYHQIEMVVQLRAVRPVNLAEIPLDSIADHGITHFARYCDAKFAPLTVSPDRV
jgi:hypothetical protein